MQREKYVFIGQGPIERIKAKNCCIFGEFLPHLVLRGSSRLGNSETSYEPSIKHLAEPRVVHVWGSRIASKPARAQPLASLLSAQRCRKARFFLIESARRTTFHVFLTKSVFHLYSKTLQFFCGMQYVEKLSNEETFIFILSLSTPSTLQPCLPSLCSKFSQVTDYIHTV